MTERRTAPYGSWRSPITAESIAQGATGLLDPALDGGDVYWLEMRPSEGGRNAVVRSRPGTDLETVVPPEFHVRTRVHEYGGGDYLPRDGVVYCSHFPDQRVFRVAPGRPPEAITPPTGDRFADFTVDPARGRLVCVRESWPDAAREPDNSIAAVPLDGGAPSTLVEGRDFFAHPRLSPDGRRLAWLAWDHPNMPWDGTELWVGSFSQDGAIRDAERVAGGIDESILQPEWSPDGVLHFLSDRSGWWNLYRCEGAAIRALSPRAAEFGRPQWRLRPSTYGFESSDRILCAFEEDGRSQLARLDLRSGDLAIIDQPYRHVGGIQVGDGFAVFVGGSPNAPTAIVSLDLDSLGTKELRRSTELPFDRAYLSRPAPVEFPTENGATAFGYHYPPANPEYRGPDGERPPLRVIAHGGPTGASLPVLNLGVQYWTSRGFAVLDVNYGGSSGHGREYRRRLEGQWGVVDVDDCVNGALYLAGRDLVDRDRMAIMGGSAGGYTVLSALTFRDVFRAGASYFGISDLESMRLDTHKFESRYLDRLVGAYPQRSDLYRERSPIHSLERLTAPVILFQGLEDRIVPPDQSQRIAEALRALGRTVEYVEFEGELHGFRKAESIRRTLEDELAFYSRAMGFPLPESEAPA